MGYHCVKCGKMTDNKETGRYYVDGECYCEKCFDYNMSVWTDIDLTDMTEAERNFMVGYLMAMETHEENIMVKKLIKKTYETLKVI